jgi:hypothetical protein
MPDFRTYHLDGLETPPYPPYHEGRDLEGHFIDFFFAHKKHFDDTGHTFIPVRWTAIYNHHRHLAKGLQEELDRLDPRGKYFTVSQHVDAPRERLPASTLNFSAGGNAPDTVPIPLICSAIKDAPMREKDIFCSFVGSVPARVGGNCTLAHDLRNRMLEVLSGRPGYLLEAKQWTAMVEKDRLDRFIDITSRSEFTLCPRGYGATSFRLYEAMQLRSVPVYIFTDRPFLPFASDVDWSRLCVLLDFKDIGDLDAILKSVTAERRAEMLAYTKEIYPQFFTLEGMCANILKHLERNPVGSWWRRWLNARSSGTWRIL